LSVEVVERNTEIAKALVDAFRKLRERGIPVPRRLTVVFGAPRVDACGFFKPREGEIAIGTYTPVCNPLAALLHEVRHYHQYLEEGEQAFWKDVDKPWNKRRHELDAEYWARENLKLLAEELRRVGKWLQR